MMNKGSCLALVLMTLLLGLPPLVHGGVITDVQGFQIVARLTGADSMNRTDQVGVGGTDLGHMVNHNRRTYFLFGDTFSSETSVPGTDWRSNEHTSKRIIWSLYEVQWI